MLLSFSIPSTKISSPTENILVLNPKTGVDSAQVTTPVGDDVIELIDIPLLLLIATILCFDDPNPKG